MDAITIQILRNKVASLVDEMHYHFYRSGYSTIIRESRDFSCVILDREGRLIVAPPMFFHAPVYRHLVRRILEVYGGTQSIKAGDVFVSNHPYEGGLPHVSDMAFVAPAFAAGEIVAFAGSIAHKADVGGAVAGSTSADATEMFQEGLLVPPIKVVDAGVAQTDVERIILTNSRQPALMRGDIQAQIAVTQMGAHRVQKLCERFGAGTVMEAFAAILNAAADELRAAIARLPEGESAAEGLLDSDGVVIDRPVKLAVTVAIKDGIASFDFSNSDPQARGPVNLRPSMVEACVFYALIGCLGPNLHFNDGMRDVVRLRYAPRTVTNAEPPAPVSNYQMVNLKLVDVLLEALGRFHPVRAIANAGSSSALTIAWVKGRCGQSTMPHQPLRTRPGHGRRGSMARRIERAARIRASGKRDCHSPLRQEPLPPRRPCGRQGGMWSALRHQTRHPAGSPDAFGTLRDASGRALSIAKRRRRRLWRSPPTRSRCACPRHGRGICLGRRGDKGLRQIASACI